MEADRLKSYQHQLLGVSNVWARCEPGSSLVLNQKVLRRSLRTGRFVGAQGARLPEPVGKTRVCMCAYTRGHAHARCQPKEERTTQVAAPKPSWVASYWVLRHPGPWCEGAGCWHWLIWKDRFPIKSPLILGLCLLYIEHILSFGFCTWAPSFWGETKTGDALSCVVQEMDTDTMTGAFIKYTPRHREGELLCKASVQRAVLAQSSQERKWR